MKIIHDQLIGIYHNALPSDWCDDIIQIFEQNIDKSVNRQEKENISGSLKKDIFLNGYEIIPPEYLDYFQDIFFKKILNLYVQQYPTFETILNEPFSLVDFKLQKTQPGEGYHVWHFETENVEVHINRFLVWTVYLNDVEEGGETEFLFQHKRVKPKKGTLCIFPSYFTHTHRGNPPLSGKKYIGTGWVSYDKIHTIEERGYSDNYFSPNSDSLLDEGNS